MIRRISLATIAASLAAMAMAPAALADVNSFEVPIDGDSFVCEGESYTVSEGSLNVRVRERESAQGNTHLTVTIKPRATLLDDAGREYKLVGAESVHVSTNANTGGLVVHEVFHVVIVAKRGGGAVGRVAEIFHLTVNNNNVHELDVSLGSCEGPIPPA